MDAQIKKSDGTWKELTVADSVKKGGGNWSMFKVGDMIKAADGDWHPLVSTGATMIALTPTSGNHYNTGMPYNANFNVYVTVNGPDPDDFTMSPNQGWIQAFRVYPGVAFVYCLQNTTGSARAGSVTFALKSNPAVTTTYTVNQDA